MKKNYKYRTTSINFVYHWVYAMSPLKLIVLFEIMIGRVKGI